METIKGFILIIAGCLLLFEITATLQKDVVSVSGSRSCVSDCGQLVDGDYPSCHGCQLYVTCQSGHMTDRRRCPPGLVFDDSTSSCDFATGSCGIDDATYMTLRSEEFTNEDPADHVVLEFSTERGQQVALNLTRNPRVTRDIPLYSQTQGGGGIFRLNVPGSKFVLYTDIAAQAAIIMRLGNQSALRPQYSGVVTLHNISYFLQPLSAEQRTRRRRDDIQPAEYVFTPLHDSTEDMLTDYSGSVAEPLPTPEPELEGVFTPSTPGNRSYIVETMLFVDYSIYDNWYSLSRKDTDDARRQEAMENIKYYYANVFNGVDLRYQSIDKTILDVSVKLNAIYIAQRPEDSPWTENNRTDSYVEAYDSMNDFENWLTMRLYQLPHYDVAALFTSFTLYNGVRDDGAFRTITGLANIKGVCRNDPVFYGTTINFDGGLFASATTAAHEIAHSLGAYHDGNPLHASNCSGEDQFIMASSPGVLTDDSYQNSLTFSSCSIESIRQHLYQLTLRGRNCLLSSDYPELITDVDLLPGHRYSPDEQCQIRYGKHSYYCAGGDKDRNICRQMECYVAATDSCYVTAHQMAADGTTCGNKQWCMSGQCVHSDLAPSAPDSCIYGDYRGRLSPYYDVFCSDIIDKSRFQCYEDFDACCESCTGSKDNSKPGCEFGNHHMYCTPHEDVNPRDCYTKHTRSECCATCSQFERQYAISEDCKYGDKATWCEAAIQGDGEHFRCYNEGDTCCRTCALLRDETRPDCAFGDRAGWCYNLTAVACYNEYNSRMCCHRCHQFSTGDQLCPYGFVDHSNYCTLRECADPNTWVSCCSTCMSAIQVSRGEPVGRRGPVVTTRPTTVPTSPSTEAEAATCTDSVDYCAHMPAEDCYVANYAQLCCRRCQSAHTAVSGCEYGDRAAWCSRYIERVSTDSDCTRLDASTRYTCCWSCLQRAVNAQTSTQAPTLRTILTSASTSTMTTPVTSTTTSTITTTTGPSLAPEPYWCVRLYPGSCYNPETEQICHSTCATRKDVSRPGCAYGNKYTWCRQEYCATEARDCCHSCS